MNSNNKQLFLAGGGSELDSVEIDRCFSAALDKEKHLLYIPNAIKSKPHDECLKWLKSVFCPLGVSKFKMLPDLTKIDFSASSVGGVYIGGGDTVKLCHEIRESSFDAFLKTLYDQGIPIYGGSAGAIILGETVLTAPEAEGLTEDVAYGLNLLDGFSLYCHYDGEESLQGLSAHLKTRIIAIPEKSGVYSTGGKFKIVGFAPVSFFDADDKLCVYPGDSIRVALPGR